MPLSVSELVLLSCSLVNFSALTGASWSLFINWFCKSYSIWFKSKKALFKNASWKYKRGLCQLMSGHWSSSKWFLVAGSRDLRQNIHWNYLSQICNAPTGLLTGSQTRHQGWPTMIDVALTIWTTPPPILGGTPAFIQGSAKYPKNW